jgi:hypothetical protein
MLTETDFQLSANQWELLRALLVSLVDDVPALTTTGRTVVLRGCPKLWDLAA